MIKILNSSFERQCIIKQVINPNRFEEINGENRLTFSTILDEKASKYINENAVVELDEDYFDVVYYKKNQNQDGTLTIDVETEHISYRLNDSEYDMEYFASTGTPATVLAALLNGTGFTVGTVEYSGSITYSIQEKKSRRMMLMEFTTLLGGEVEFNKFTVSILQHRGNEEPKLLAKGKNIKIISKIFNKREKDENGNPLISYTCEPIMLPNEPLQLGDEVLLVQKDLGIQEQLRIVRIGYNPYNPIEAEVELSNFMSGLEDQIYRIETTTVAKEKVYNGCKIGPEEGFVAERSDGKAKTVMNATEGISIFSDVGNGLERNFYVDLNGRIQARALDIAGDATFEGTITASDIIGGTIDIGNGTFTVDSQGNMIAKSGTFGGTIRTSTNAEVGNLLYLGRYLSSGEKGIIFNTGIDESSILLKTSGELALYNWNDIWITSSEDIELESMENILLIGNLVDITCWDGGAVILDYETYVGEVDYDHYVATFGDIENAILAHIAEYH